MRIEIEADPDVPRPPVRPPTNYMSNTVRIRIFVLFAMLILVLIMMKEARKPERWGWMGFGPQPPQQIAEAHKLVAPGAPGRPVADAAQRDRVASIADMIDRSMVSEYPVVGRRFWREVFVPLKMAERQLLSRFLRTVCDRTTENLEKTPESFRQLVDSMQDKRDLFNERLAEQVSFLPEATDDKRELENALNKSRLFWARMILPAWRATLAGEDITSAQQNANVRLLGFLESLALDEVEDGTALNRNREGLAWLLCWQRARNIRPGSATPVSHIQLSGQPRVFRGMPVSVEGWVRSARRLNVKPNEIGIDHYFVLWVRAVDTNVAPYCIYALELPEGFPSVGFKSLELNERISIVGVFFKIRSYTAGNNQLATCPLLLAESFTWNPVDTANRVDAWFPPAWAIWSFLILMPIVAAVVAWLAFKGAETRRFVPGPKTQEKISDALVDLQQNPNIQTDLERVKALYDSQFDDLDNGESEFRGRGA